MPMFNTLLAEVGIDPASVQLVRHQDQFERTTPYALWRGSAQALEDYQRLQSREIFDVGGTLASFVVTPNAETLFVGLYRVVAASRNNEPATCPLRKTVHPTGTINVYQIVTMPEMAPLSGLLTIDWGPGARAWVQRALNQNKAVREIRVRREDPPFPGFLGFECISDDIATLPQTWSAILGATGGVYLLVSMENGEQYVGSATGEEGFMGRWVRYAADGHGGNILLRERGRPPYAISVLETAPESASRDDVIRAEQRWKRRLGTRAFGLNAN